MSFPPLRSCFSILSPLRTIYQFFEPCYDLSRFFYSIFSVLCAEQFLLLCKPCLMFGIIANRKREENLSPYWYCHIFIFLTVSDIVSLSMTFYGMSHFCPLYYVVRVFLKSHRSCFCISTLMSYCQLQLFQPHVAPWFFISTVLYIDGPAGVKNDSLIQMLSDEIMYMNLQNHWAIQS